MRQCYVTTDVMNKSTLLYNELHRYDREIARRANEAYARDNPPETRHREHGWHLSNDD